LYKPSFQTLHFAAPLFYFFFDLVFGLYAFFLGLKENLLFLSKGLSAGFFFDIFSLFLGGTMKSFSNFLAIIYSQEEGNDRTYKTGSDTDNNV
jgi:hypothetical protein